MKTDDLISMLVTGVQPIDRRAPEKRLGVVVLFGLSLATLCVVSFFGVRVDIAYVVSTIIFWVKTGLPLCVMVGALLMLDRLARPGMSVGAGSLWVVVALVAVWAAAFNVLANAEPDVRPVLLLGETWRTCAPSVAMLSIPGFIAAFWALRGLAPTRLRMAGACCGMLAGALGCLAYCLHCPEMEVPFWAVWYFLGMLLPTALGALAGPWLLRW
ncbi:DUF1109 domain-containing protein [Pseudomonas caspiana]|uniref:DUF1109 domain-containing protein n=1 Tax=Pseudomonas caspiana TaxID=1451454 RepID=UPI0032EDAA7E